MIIVQTPLRISFLGGGTDFEDFYRNGRGAVLSTAIDKFTFVIVKERFDDMVYVNYSKKEIVDDFNKLEHELVREAMRRTGVTRGVEITTLADVPSEGTGLGSSSSILVGLLHALYAFRGDFVSSQTLAEDSCRIEIDVLKKPIGKQDQYMAAYGKTRLLTFTGNGVAVESVSLPPGLSRKLHESLLLFYTGMGRKASDILLEQKSNINDKLTVLNRMQEMAFQARDTLLRGDLDRFGEYLHEGWELKRGLASCISNSKIDAMYAAARRAGAIGGKITGAGGGGFLLLYCPWEKQDAVRGALDGLREFPFHFEQDGSKVIFNYNSRSNHR